MGLVKRTYTNYSTVITAENLNNIQDAIIDNETSIAELGTTINGKITNPPGGFAGNVLKKTASGVEWGQGGGSGDSSLLATFTYTDSTMSAITCDTTLETVMAALDAGIMVRGRLAIKPYGSNPFNKYQYYNASYMYYRTYDGESYTDHKLVQFMNLSAYMYDEEGTYYLVHEADYINMNVNTGNISFGSIINKFEDAPL